MEHEKILQELRLEVCSTHNIQAENIIRTDKGIRIECCCTDFQNSLLNSYEQKVTSSLSKGVIDSLNDAINKLNFGKK